jgi:predicted alpha/beta superfamily hydrolase
MAAATPMTMRLLLPAFLFVSGCTQPGTVPPPRSPDAATPLVIGETFRFDSRVLGEQRTINVYLPPGYAEGADRLPVLYALDGGLKEDFPHLAGHVDVSIKNQVIRPILVVGIENTERRRDLAGPTSVPEEQAMAPHAGGADRFRRFLRDELVPHVAARYRTGESAVIGESLAGLFALETLLVDPGLFDACIAVDPSVWWNGQALVRSAAGRFAAWSAPPRVLFVATADYAETQDAVAILLAAVREHRPPGLTVHHEPMPGEQHGTIFPFAALKGIRWVFAAPKGQ